MKTLIYTRGKAEQKQIEICEEYAQENGLEIVNIVDNDKDVTAFALSGQIDCVIVSHASRITRRRSEYMTAEKMLNDFGVKLIAVGGAK